MEQLPGRPLSRVSTALLRLAEFAMRDVRDKRLSRGPVGADKGVFCVVNHVAKVLGLHSWGQLTSGNGAQGGHEYDLVNFNDTGSGTLPKMGVDETEEERYIRVTDAIKAELDARFADSPAYR